MDTLELIIQPTIETLIAEDYIDPENGDALLFEQGVRRQELVCDAGDRFALPEGYEALTADGEPFFFECAPETPSAVERNGVWIVPEDFFKLSPGHYCYKGIRIVQRAELERLEEAKMVSEDVIWDVITESAKTRFDYKEFRKSFDGFFENKSRADMALFTIVAGCAGRLSAEEIVDAVNQDLLPFGLLFPVDVMKEFLTDNKQKLYREIMAVDAAQQALELGWGVPGVLMQVKGLLTGS